MSLGEADLFVQPRVRSLSYSSVNCLCDLLSEHLWLRLRMHFYRRRIQSRHRNAGCQVLMQAFLNQQPRQLLFKGGLQPRPLAALQVNAIDHQSFNLDIDPQAAASPVAFSIVLDVSMFVVSGQ